MKTNFSFPFTSIQIPLLKSYFPCRRKSDMSLSILHDNILQMDNKTQQCNLSITVPRQLPQFKVSSKTFVLILLNFWRLSEKGYFSLDIKKVSNSFYNSDPHHLNSKRDTLRFKFSLYYICKINLGRTSGGLQLKPLLKAGTSCLHKAVTMFSRQTG